MLFFRNYSQTAPSPSIPEHILASDEAGEIAKAFGGTDGWLDPGDVTVLFARTGAFTPLEMLMGHPHKQYFPELGVNDYMRQLVLYRGEWIGAVLWECVYLAAHMQILEVFDPNAKPVYYDVARIRKFIPRPSVAGENVWGNVALSAALVHLKSQIESIDGYNVRVAEIILTPDAPESRYYRDTGWSLGGAVSDDTVCWLYNLLPGSTMDIDAHNLASCSNDRTMGRFPVSCSALESLKDALQTVGQTNSDPRVKYQLGSLLSLAFCTVVCGAVDQYEMAELGLTLRSLQADAFDLPPADDMKQRIPCAGTFVKYCRSVDGNIVLQILETWLREHSSELPEAMSPYTPFMKRRLSTMNRIMEPPQPLCRDRRTGKGRPRRKRTR